jgi:tetratricopeptide (TPR) repeat protein
MKTLRPTLAVLACAVSLGGCAHLPDRIASLWRRDKVEKVEVRPVARETQLSKTVDLKAVEAAAVPAALAASRTDRLYNQAVAALKSRDYGRALDLLQMAKADGPQDPRVLNALGVTYDKLGRFDLSDRYYRTALLSDPNSRIVRSNMQYSAMLQRDQRGLVTPAPSEVLQAKAPEVAPAFRLAQAETSARVQEPVLVGRPLLIINASGASALGSQVQVALAERGWTVGAQQVAAQRRSGGALLSYPERHNAAAVALARTLPFAVEMVACRNGCDGLTLTLGAQTRWKS